PVLVKRRGARRRGTKPSPRSATATISDLHTLRAGNLSGTDYQLEAAAGAADLAGTRSGKFGVSWAGDTDGNCRVSIADVSLVVTHYGKTSADPA
ncbi:MAG: hypothetical protein NTZ05_08490, partial [Chloroflexi bacterium]|nr:hypothetical protein [Chloroflexota bacterium]